MQTGNVELRLIVNPQGAIVGVTKFGNAAVTQGAKTESAFKGVESQTKRVESALTGLGSKARTVERDMSSLARSSSMLGDVFKGALGANLVTGGLIGLAAGAREFSGAAIDAANQAQAVTQALKFATGGAEAGRQEFEFLREEAKRLGFDLQSSAAIFARLAAAARGTTLAGEGVRDIFSAVSEAGVTLRLSADQQAGALNAIQQMMSKGTVQAEELRGQLGERLPGAFQLAAKSMGVSTAQLGKMLEQGEVFADEFLPKFAKALHDEYGKPAEEAGNTAAAAIQRFNNDAKSTAATIGGVLVESLGAAAKAYAFFADARGKVQGNIGFQPLLDRADAASDARVKEEALNKAKADGLRLAKEAKALEDQKTRGPNNAQQGVIDKAREADAKKKKEDAKAAIENAKKQAQQVVDARRSLEDSQVGLVKSKTEQQLQALDLRFEREKAALGSNHEAIKLLGQARHNEEKAILEAHSKELSDVRLKAAGELNIRLQAENQQALAREKEFAEARRQSAFSTASNILQAGQMLFAGTRKNAVLLKTLAIGEIGVNTGRAVMQALATPPGPPATLPMALSIGALGLAQALKVSQQKFAQGGIVPGSSTSGDRVQALVNSGEMILNKPQQAQLFAVANGRGGGGGVSIGDINITLSGTATRADAELVGDAVDRRLRQLVDDLETADYRGLLRKPVHA